MPKHNFSDDDIIYVISKQTYQTFIIKSMKRSDVLYDNDKCVGYDEA